MWICFENSLARLHTTPCRDAVKHIQAAKRIQKATLRGDLRVLGNANVRIENRGIGHLDDLKSESSFMWTENILQRP